MTIFGAIQHQEDVLIHQEWLHPLEIKYLNDLRFQKRKQDWLLGRWTSKKLLQQVLFQDFPMNEIEIRKGPNREPIVLFKSEPVFCRLSISHSHGQSFCVLSKEEMALGCDLEKVEIRSELFIRDYFTDLERTLFSTIYSQFFNRDNFFTLLWSAKESVMKACLTGLSIPAKSIELVEIKGFKADSWSEISLQNLRDGSLFSGLCKLEEGFVWVVLTEGLNRKHDRIRLEMVHSEL
jgi:4'-phosphopantetheinyl transferase